MKMKIEKLVESLEGTTPKGTLRVNPKTGGTIAKGRPEASQRGQSTIAIQRAYVAAYLRERQGLPDEEEGKSMSRRGQLRTRSATVAATSSGRLHAERITYRSHVVRGAVAFREANFDCSKTNSVGRAIGNFEPVDRRSRVVAVLAYSPALREGR